eukprot:TRINITY_DN2245_c0_g1_i3.p1 TRINITY_DN2245_c0_g1~~TRINITY_DN2245_c0_g1_i3.p1  ORF type:complete len:158 (+),score=43.61 TRINITY_DN2245_c0_g1_i3:243-716(+)
MEEIQRATTEIEMRRRKRQIKTKKRSKVAGTRVSGVRAARTLVARIFFLRIPRVGRVQGGRDQASKEKGGRDRSRSPVARGGGKEAGQLREEARMGFNIGRKPQIRQSKAKEGESQREKPGERELVQPASRGKWEGFGWSSRNTGEELGQVSDDSDD